MILQCTFVSESHDTNHIKHTIYDYVSVIAKKFHIGTEVLELITSCFLATIGRFQATLPADLYSNISSTRGLKRTDGKTSSSESCSRRFQTVSICSFRGH